MKKLISILLTSVMLTSQTAFAVEYGEELKKMPTRTYEQKFSDVPTSHWAFNYISELVNDNGLSGYPDGQFRPNNNVTRAEFAKIMISASGIQAVPASASSFSDVSLTDWCSPYIESAKEFLTGYNYSGEAMYLPNKTALREDIAVALVKLKCYDTSVADLGMIQAMFSDYDSISESAKRYVAVAVERGLVSGYEDGTFKGQQSITRAEAATLIWRANQYGSDNKIMGSETTEISQTTAPTAEPSSTPEPTAEPTQVSKPYKISTLADADVKDYMAFTPKDNDIFYIDSTDDCVYKVDVKSGKKTAFIDDLSSLTYEDKETQEVEEEEEITETVETGDFEELEEEVTETVIDETTGDETEVTKTVTKQVPITKEETKTVSKKVSKEVVKAEYSDFNATQICYDVINKKILLIGNYKNIEKPFEGTKNTEYYAIYDISNGKYDFLYGLDDCNGLIYIAAIGNNEYCVEYKSSYFSYRPYKLNVKKGTLHKMEDGNSTLYADSMIKNGNDIFFVDGSKTYGGGSFDVKKYDFSKENYYSVTDGRSYIPYDSLGTKNDSYFYWSGNEFKKISVSSGKTTTLSINTKSENVEFEDMGGLNNISERMIIVDDNTIIFYDNNMQAFRKLEKNS